MITSKYLSYSLMLACIMLANRSFAQLNKAGSASAILIKKIQLDSGGIQTKETFEVGNEIKHISIAVSGSYLKSPNDELEYQLIQKHLQ